MQRIRPTKVSTPVISEARMTWPQLIPAKAWPTSIFWPRVSASEPLMMPDWTTS